jgi:N-hydroxyarylamine O-acetyltransferase
MLTVPFENLDIGLGRKILCDKPSIVRKIVEQRRGGFCYELNGAFAALLRELGFKVTLLSARVARQDGSYGPEFDHLTLRVDLGEPWLADVGFGDSFLEPLRLKTGIEQPQGRKSFRLVEEEGLLYMEMAEPGADWKRQYSFTLLPRQLGDFAGMCHYHQTSPQSSFTQKKICSRATLDGRITLADGKLIITQNGKREESLLASDQDWKVALKKYFEIVL